MPLIEVKMFDRRIEQETVDRVVHELTEALSRAVGEDVRSGTWVIVEGIPPTQWGIDGKTFS